MNKKILRWNFIRKLKEIFKYLFAVSYDLFITCALLMAFTLVCLIIRNGSVIQPQSHWFQLCLMLIWFLYYSFSLKLGGQTIGMRAWRLKIVSVNTGSLTWYQIGLRTLLMLPALIQGALLLKSPGMILANWSKTELLKEI